MTPRNHLYGSLPKPKRSKYGNRKIMLDGILFDSIAEMNRWAKLRQWEMAGAISELKRQVPYLVCPPVRLCEEDRASGIKYVVDFQYNHTTDGLVLEDVKGIDTPISRLKRRLIKHQYGLDVRIVK